MCLTVHTQQITFLLLRWVFRVFLSAIFRSLMKTGAGVIKRIKKEIKEVNGKPPTGKEEDLFISISLAAAPSLELSLGPGYRKSLLLSSIVARISPSKHTQTGNKQEHTHTHSSCFCSVMTRYSGDLTCPYGIIRKHTWRHQLNQLKRCCVS